MMGYHRENCRRKRRYHSQQQAQRSLARRRKADPGAVEGVVAYRCCFCRGWHLGHVPSVDTLEQIALEVRGLK